MIKMSVILTIAVVVVCTTTGIAQSQEKLNAIGKNVQDSYKKNPDSVVAMADAAIKVFTWDIEKEEKGTLMFLDVPYQRTDKDSMEYLTLTVAKGKGDARPAFISVIVPNNVVYSNGIFIKFASTITDKDGNRTIKLDDEKPLRLAFEQADPKKDYYTARIIGGYATGDETNQKTDIFQKFMDYDHVLFLFIYPDGSHKSVAVPLFSFKEQYKTLE